MTSTEKPATPVVATAHSAPAKTATSKKPARTTAAKPAAKSSKTVAAATPKAPAAKKAAANVTKKAGTAAAKTKASAKPAAQPATVKAPKAKKPKMVRDSFTIPKPEYDVLDVLKLRAAKLGNPVKKTELIRAGVKAIAALSDAAFKQALLAVPSLKTGRPAKAKKA
ncbi:hypothetical protein CHU94_11955 [Rhodoferax sp. TH121]|uniref:hypothetical protein n=1 Tax=Rhodoferax sp. TH121 TaxID=2022803 RepID=UPI000B97949E|nr:hypothetical protein [Rhodoferax sp. TH121]OYQ40039.1 hypothetical protein CHU94_11955 [Rhodoferax sp. TH121]